MTHTFQPLLAAEGVIRTTFEWGRIQSNADWIPPIAVCIAILLFVRYMYRRDAMELHPAWKWFLTVLRTATFLGLLVLYLQPHWRAEREEVRNSQALLLVDTSLSMGLTDDAAVETQEKNNSRQPAAAGKNSNRAQRVAAALKESDFLARLRKTHDVAVFEFSEDLKRDRVVTLSKQTADNSPSNVPRSQPGGVDDPPDWTKLLAPRGVETRLGQALRQLIHDERGSPISGIIVFSDGGQNAGISPQSAVEAAQEAKIPVFTVGLGSDRQPVNVAISDLVVPARAYPGDRYTVTGYVQAQGMAGQAVTVQVLSRPTGDGATTTQGDGELLDSQQVTLGEDGEVLPVKFDLVPDVSGRRTLCVRVQAPKDDRNSADNVREADIEIVDRKNHVLLLADGPMREYQFLRNQLFRDHYTTLDVLLQSSQSGSSQEATNILGEFPATRHEMYDYDCVVAFDPDWEALGTEQIDLLENWVAEQGGGLIVVGGPVHTCRGSGSWVENPDMAKIRNLYPVEFPGRLAATEDNMYSSSEPWALGFTREGMEADFLWLSDTAVVSREAWAEFPGVYGFCPVRGPKPGAVVYARFADSGATLGGSQQPVYFAGQFYGAGSVFYMGSGEMWRLRSIDETFFEQFYTKLIRHVSQGRLLRGSSRGVLLVGQDRYLLGNTVEVRAQLSDAQLEPLGAPSVDLQLIQPDGAAQTIQLRADPTRAGAFLGQFPALMEGTYRLELPVPESPDERLSRRIQVKAPDLERENPRRNDVVLSTIANNTGGKYYLGMDAAIAANGPAPLVAQLKDQTTVVIQPVAPNPKKEENWLRWMMIALCSFLCMEWLARRLLKLA